MLLIVLMSEMALAPPRFAARAAAVMSVMLGVSFAITGMVATSMTQPTIVSATSGFWPTAEPMPRSHMPWGQPKFSSIPSAPQSAERLTKSCQFSRVSTMSEAMTGVVRPAFFHFGDLAEIGFRRAIADQLDVVEADHPHVAVIDRGVTRGDVADRVADRFPNDAAPAGFEGAMRLVSGVGRRAGGDPERVGGFDAGEIGGKISHCRLRVTSDRVEGRFRGRRIRASY